MKTDPTTSALMANAEAKLLPCPFCGNAPDTRMLARSRWYCSNHSCAARDINVTAEQWNTRHPASPAEQGGEPVGEDIIKLLAIKFREERRFRLGFETEKDADVRAMKHALAAYHVTKKAGE